MTPQHSSKATPHSAASATNTALDTPDADVRTADDAVITGRGPLVELGEDVSTAIALLTTTLFPELLGAAPVDAG